MGYELHITRAEHWSDNEQHPITAEEWLAVVTSDPELHIDTQNGPYFAVWSGPCSYPDGGWFEWFDGNISTKHPDRAILGKMLQIAARLGAHVQGDDGEMYAAPEDLLSEEQLPEAPQRPWWKFW
jgi:hypothetical protein